MKLISKIAQRPSCRNARAAHVVRSNRNTSTRHRQRFMFEGHTVSRQQALHLIAGVRLQRTSMRQHESQFEMLAECLHCRDASLTAHATTIVFRSDRKLT